jgi:hypothetical protein
MPSTAKKKPIKIKLTKVESAAVHSVGHHPATQTLRIKFQSGHIGDYAGVSAEKHAALLAADSIGKHFHEHIRNAHAHTRVDA